jgi:CRISPR/Cas system-associated exonuclease Cas4 (RecB family)
MSLVDAYLRSRQQVRKIRPRGTLYVTDLVKPCLLQAYYSITQPREYSVEKLRIFEAGNVLEDFWAQILSDNLGVRVFGTQVPAYFIADDLEIHGRVDVLAQHSNASIVAHEVKSAKSAHWMETPRDGHVEQLQFYLNVLDINQGQVDYLDKESFVLGENPIDKSFQIIRDPSIFYLLISRAGTLSQALKTGILPEANREAWNGRICDYCQYQDLCKPPPTPQE